ncbi:hydrolase [Sodalis sp. RH21]|uniref:hydrolase n=1 Tax=unclassified Sodalis (in: enterobacteria) TaxID=2636512 RepID=UPI0039B4FE20
MLKLDPKCSALVLIDLQEGIVPFAKGPYSGEQVVGKAGRLAAHFRQAGAAVVLVRVGWSPDFADAPKQQVDAPNAGHALPDNWWEFPQALGVEDSDIRVTKRQWGAFYGTDLDLQLRRRGITTIVLAGIATNIGVESTARNAWEMGYDLVLVEDVCSTQSKEQHDNSVQNIFPRIGRVRSSEEVLAAF